MTQMTRCTSLSPLGREFDDFLFARIGEEKNGMMLSVLSALARLDVDPWQEADELAQMPGEAATKRLALLIASLPDRPSAHPDPRTVADRLVALLPRHLSSNVPSSATIGVGEKENSRAKSMVFFMLIMALATCAQIFMASRQPRGQLDKALTPASSTAASEGPLASEHHGFAAQTGAGGPASGNVSAAVPPAGG
jgi:hypothetical protein